MSLILATCNYTATYADGFVPSETDYQPRTMVVCGGGLYLLYHGGCPDRGLYLMSIDEGISVLAGDNHGSESSVVCRNDTFYVAYYYFGDSAVVVGASYDGGNTWHRLMVADTGEFAEDEPTLLLVGDTLHLTFVYEISGPEIQWWKIPINGGEVVKEVIPVPYVAHNGPMLRGEDGALYLLVSSWDIEGGGYVLRYRNSTWEYGEVSNTGMPYDMELYGDTLIAVAGVLGPRENRDVVVCTSDTSLRFYCSKVVEGVGRVTNVELVPGAVSYLVWSDNSEGNFRLRMAYSEDLTDWTEIPLDDHVPADAQTYFPIAARWGKDLYVAYTTDYGGKPSVSILSVGASDSPEPSGRVRKYCGYYDSSGRRLSKGSRVRIRLGCEGKYVRFR